MCFIFRLKKSEDAEERVIPLTALPFSFDIECVIWIIKVVHGCYHLWMYILDNLVSPSLCTIHKYSQPYFSYRPIWSVTRYMGEIPFVLISCTVISRRCLATPFPRYSFSVYTAQTLGLRSFLSWKSFSIIPMPLTILSRERQRYYPYSVSLLRYASMHSRYEEVGTPHFDWNHSAAEAFRSALSLNVTY